MTTGGVVLSPISTPITAVCSTDLITKEDLFLLYAEYFFPWEIDPSGLSHIYGVYDASAGETQNMCLGIDDRQALMKNLWFSYQRMAETMRFYALPTYVTGERQSMNGSDALHLRKGYVTGVAERSCVEVGTDVGLTEDDDGLWSVEVAMPSSAWIDDLVVYEHGARKVRVPIAERELSIDGLTATLRFYRPTLVKAATWAACTPHRSPCDCSVEASSASSFMESVDVYHIAPSSNTGLDITRDCSCTPVPTTTCGAIENPVLGFVRGLSTYTACTCWPRPSVVGSPVYVTAYYTSGRWTRDTIPEDVMEALFGMAFTLMPETGLCQEGTRPAHMRNYRELVPADVPGGMRPLGQVMMRAAVRTYANGSGI